MTYAWRTPLLLVYAFLAFPAFSQVTHTWVSSNGVDTNPCSRSAPCFTWAGAISKTTAGGEIDALDSGSFGTVTINKSITLDGGEGTISGIAASGTNAITISAGSTDTVVLRNLSINGAGTPLGINGINIVSAGSVHIEKCTIFNFSTSGITLAGANIFLTVLNSQIEDITATGISASGMGDTALLENVQLFHTGTAISTGDGTRITAHKVNIHQASSGVVATSSTGGALVTLDGASVLGTTTAVQANGSNSTIAINDSTFSENGTVFGSGTGTIGSYGNNRVKPSNNLVGNINQTYGLR